MFQYTPDNILPTTEDLFKKYSNLLQFEEGEPDYYVDKEDFKAALIEFTTLHLKAQTEAIINNASIVEVKKVDKYDYADESNYGVDKDSIRTAYSLDLVV